MWEYYPMPIKLLQIIFVGMTSSRKVPLKLNLTRILTILTHYTPKKQI